jgi:hypothetical protein
VPAARTFLPRLFAHSLHEAEPKLASCLEIAEWSGGQAGLEEPLFAEADCVTATGSDETLAELRGRLPVRVRLLAYGHQVSFRLPHARRVVGLRHEETHRARGR